MNILCNIMIYRKISKILDSIENKNNDANNNSDK